MRSATFVTIAATFLGAAFVACNSNPYNITGGGSPCSGSGAAVVVTANGSTLRFDPESVTVTHGQSVCWQNTGSVAHTVNSDTGAVLNHALGAGASYNVVLSSPGVIAYHCNIHQAEGMVGKVVVQ